MSPEKLVYMANQIGRFFAHRTQTAAVADIADHLRKYWEPRMRREILDYMDRGGKGFDPLVLKAVESLRPEKANPALD
jgi:formate dehydrogenase subunit delta